LRAERDALRAEHEGLRAERDTLQNDRDALQHIIDTWRRQLRWPLWIRRRLREFFSRESPEQVGFNRGTPPNEPRNFK
jgi:hypothetical protein